MTSSPARIGPLSSSSPVSVRVIASRSRASTSAGPALSRMTSSTPHSAGQPGQAALGEDGDQRAGQPGRAQHPAQGLGLRQLAAGVDEDDLAGGGVDQRGGLGRQDPHLVAEQAQSRQDLGAGGQRVGQQQEVDHPARIMGP